MFPLCGVGLLFGMVLGLLGRFDLSRGRLELPFGLRAELPGHRFELLLASFELQLGWSFRLPVVEVWVAI